MNDLQRRIITRAASKIGTPEIPDGSNRTEFGERYGWNGVAWCDIFCWDTYYFCGLRDPRLHEASCGMSVEKYNRAGLWVPFGFRTPDVGWQAFYEWGGDGWADHTEIVEKPLGGPSAGHQAIGGNVGNRVVRVVRTPQNTRRILGYGIPYGLYDQQEQEDEVTPEDLKRISVMMDAKIDDLEDRLRTMVRREAADAVLGKYEDIISANYAQITHAVRDINGTNPQGQPIAKPFREILEAILNKP